MKDIILTILIVHGPLFLFVTLLMLFLKCISVESRLMILGFALSLCYFVMVQIPYYFQGYAEIRPYIKGESLGLTKYYMVNLFAYLYAGGVNGFIWLFVGLVAVSFGKFSVNNIANTVLKLVAIGYYSFSFAELYKYSVISDYLD